MNKIVKNFNSFVKNIIIDQDDINKKNYKKKYNNINKDSSILSNNSIIYFTDYKNLINYNLPSKINYYKNIITNINNYNSLIVDGPLRGMDGTIYSIVEDKKNGIIYIGGEFTLVGNNFISNIVSYNCALNQFSPLIDSSTGQEGTNGKVISLVFDSINSKLYLGGEFNLVGGTISANFIASWDTINRTFSALIDINQNEGTDDSVRTMTLNSNNSILYFAGEISTVASGTITVNYIASWDILNNTFSALTDSTTNITGTNNSVYSLTYDFINSQLCIGGAFVNAGGIIVNYIAFWNTLNNTFSSLRDANTGYDGTLNYVYSVTFNPFNNTIYVGGTFDFSGGKMNQKITSYDINNSLWKNLGAGIQKIDDSLNTIVYTLFLDINNQILYVGGTFIQTSGIITNNISVYDINNKLWSPLTENKGRYNGITNGENYNIHPIVFSICKLNNILYIGGNFRMAGNKPVNNIAKVRLNYIKNIHGSKLFINNSSTTLKYCCKTNKWIIIY